MTKREKAVRKKEIEALLRPFRITQRGEKLPRLTQALLYLLEEEDRINVLLKALYLDVAKLCRCSPGSVEHSLRDAAVQAWERNPSYLLKLAGYPLDSAPTVSEFLEMLYTALLRTSNSDTLSVP